MIGLDTNILMRYLAQDDPVQSRRATEIITQQLSEEEPGFVSLVTILEVFWVLKSVFRRSRQDLASDIEKVLSADTLEVQNEQEVYNGVIALRTETGSFEDALVGSLGIWRGCSTTLTFDKAAARKLHGFSLA
jgi:predicted nucleic-acid-binding protein